MKTRAAPWMPLPSRGASPAACSPRCWATSADDALETLSRLAFVEATSEGLRLHDAVQSAIVERLRALDPERFRRYRAAAWHYLQTETRGVARHELARSTADLLFLIDNPVVREAMFPTTVHAYSVEPARIEDANELRSLWHRHDPPEAAHALDLWLERAPGAVRVIRDRSGALVGCSIVAEWCDIPHSLERDDPVTARVGPPRRTSSAAERAENARGTGAPSPATRVRDRAAPRPPRGSTSSGTTSECVPSSVGSTPRSPIPPRSRTRWPCWDSSSSEPVSHRRDCFHLAALEFGPESVDGWLSRLAAAELGIADRGFLDPEDRTVDLGEQRIQLSPLEFGVLATLSEQPGRAVTRAELIKQVWGTTYVGGSNVVDVVVRSLRQKLGPMANRVETHAASATASSNCRGARRCDSGNGRAELVHRLSNPLPELLDVVSEVRPPPRPGLGARLRIGLIDFARRCPDRSRGVREMTDAKPFRTATVLGGGVIGTSWAALFLADGLRGDDLRSDPRRGEPRPHGVA